MSKALRGIHYRKAHGPDKGYVITRCIECGYTYGWHAASTRTGKPVTLRITPALEWAKAKGWSIVRNAMVCPFCTEHPPEQPMPREAGELPKDMNADVNLWNIPGNERNPEYKRLADEASAGLFSSLKRMKKESGKDEAE